MDAAVKRAAPKPQCYRRRQPERTLLYRTVQTHLATWLERHHDAPGRSAPALIEREFRRYLECGILMKQLAIRLSCQETTAKSLVMANGFARARCADCGHDFVVAYSCKGRGMCPSCTTRRMVETAAHLADHVLPRLPVRQWVLSVPKRIRYYLQHDPKVQNLALHIFMSAIEQALRRSSPGAGPDARCGAVVFIHRFGALLNEHLHFHCVVLEGVFSGGEDGQAVFHPATDLHAPAFDQVQSAVRRRLLKALTRRGVLEEEEAQGMLNWQHGGGFSVDGEVRIEARDRKGLERLLRCDIRACCESGFRRVAISKAARYTWAMLIARIYEVFPLICPKCGGEMKIIAFINEKDVVQKILKHLGVPTEPPKLAKARDPPLWELQASGIEEFDPMVQVVPDYEFDQRIVW